VRRKHSPARAKEKTIATHIIQTMCLGTQRLDIKQNSLKQRNTAQEYVRYEKQTNVNVLVEKSAFFGESSVGPNRV